ncbi:hypothetical protein [Propionivibrio sp.]|uniref:hypothetical protein n=1 Tax=Propionivibrio sp. TaxID=2212460 RepID=UPI0025EFE3F8|nr:hypothetical protein [Propionivibrio sp.]MBK7356053.1 hypothetical protein [Propionivibrio sp.]MBK8400279.1 hypothetical protein [Propionivibrio sp.]MBK8744014.1 hypothetical protein [Propionivibrio sp.]MBK8893018.1 hypothetical protein [Propionivibrio sp.]
MRTSTESANYSNKQPEGSGSAWQAQSPERPMTISGNDDYQQVIAEAAFFQAQQRAKELGWGGSSRQES